MKTFYYFLLASFLFPAITVISQDIQNSGFENWSTQNYFGNPDQYTTTNYLSFFQTGTANVTKTSDAQSGSWAIHLESISTSSGPMFGAAFIGDPDLATLTGGMPFTVRPDAVSGYAKYDVQPNDTAYLAVVFKKFGAPIGYCIKTFYGNQGTYESFTQQVQWLIPIISPDTMMVGMISSSINSIPVAGSNITFDNLSFDGVSANFPNGDFENWTDLQSEEPNSWGTSNVLSITSGNLTVTKSTDSHSGSYAARIENQPIVTGDTLGFLTNGIIGDNGPIGGMPVNDIPDVLSGYYKYTPMGSDSAMAGMTLYKYDPISGQTNKIDEIFISLPAASSYTYFEVPIAYNQLPEPDTVNIAFGAGNFDENGSNGQLGSVLWVDDLNITFKPNLVAVAENDQKENLRAYPNPVYNTLFLDLKDLMNTRVTVHITDINGQVVCSQQTHPDSHVVTLDVNELVPGLYFYDINLENGKNYTGKFIVK